MRTDNAKIIAVWGSPNSGKTTLATKLATAIYDNYQATVVVLYCDLETPALPVIFPNEKAEDLGSVGIPLDCCEIKIVNPDEEGVGEIYVKGTNVMKGYYNDPEATAAAFDNGWFKTGDFGRIDKDGFLFMVGRKKNLICLSNGKNVSPEELEDKLSRIEYVKEVLVYEEDGSIIAEFFFNEAEYPDARARIKGDIDEFNSNMPIFKNINSFKVRDEEFPKTTTLKIERKLFQK